MPWSTFTLKEDALILRLRDEEGWQFPAIARELGRKHYAVYNRYRDLKAVEVSGAALRRGV